MVSSPDVIPFGWLGSKHQLTSWFVWRIRTKIVEFMCRQHDPFFQYIERNLGEYLWENTLQLRSWGSAVEVSAAATLLQTTIVICTACTETIRRWLYYKPLFPVTGKNNNNNKQQQQQQNLNWGKDLLEKSLSALWTIDSCALTCLLKSVPGCQNSSQHKLPGLFFLFFFFNQ